MFDKLWQLLSWLVRHRCRATLLVSGLALCGIAFAAFYWRTAGWGWWWVMDVALVWGMPALAVALSAPKPLVQTIFRLHARLTVFVLGLLCCGFGVGAIAVACEPIPKPTLESDAAFIIGLFCLVMGLAFSYIAVFSKWAKVAELLGEMLGAMLDGIL